MPARHPPAGVTLPELLLVLTLIGVLSALAVPAFTAYLQRLRVRSALDRLAGEVYLAQMLAVRKGTRVHLRFVPSAGCARAYEVVRMDLDEVVRRVEVGEGGDRVCLQGNVSRPLSIDSRGLLVGSARTVHARSGAQSDSVIISMVGRIFRSR
jgi:prepilin-type N-terminal cleavage/methylation domain-containing protein